MKKLTVKTFIKHEGEYVPIETLTALELENARKAIAKAMSDALSNHYTLKKEE